MRADRLRLLDAVEQAELITRFSQTGREAFLGDALIQSAVLHRLASLGEACRGLSSELRDAHSLSICSRHTAQVRRQGGG
jgi:uncharacterized protein with HEPN domain